MERRLRTFGSARRATSGLSAGRAFALLHVSTARAPVVRLIPDATGNEKIIDSQCDRLCLESKQRRYPAGFGGFATISHRVIHRLSTATGDKRPERCLSPTRYISLYAT